MTYNEFLNSLTSGINIFINNISLVADSLLHNYIFITFFGIVIFVSLFHFLTDYLFDYIHSTRNNIEEEIDLYKKYKKYQLVKLKFLHKDRKIVYDINYLNHMIKQGVMRDYISQHYNDYKNLQLVKYEVSQDNKYRYLIKHTDDYKNLKALEYRGYRQGIEKYDNFNELKLKFLRAKNESGEK